MKRPETIEQALQESPDDYLQCRLNHWWRTELSYGPTHKGRVQRNWALEQKVCVRCGAETEVVWDAHFDRKGGTSRYPEGYLIVGLGRASRRDVRREILERSR